MIAACVPCDVSSPPLLDDAAWMMPAHALRVHTRAMMTFVRSSRLEMCEALSDRLTRFRDGSWV